MSIESLKNLVQEIEELENRYTVSEYRRKQEVKTNSILRLEIDSLRQTIKNLQNPFSDRSW